ncbi:MAG: ABC transporter ATP-binding protein, partial [Anaerolineales bacterium]|nr:ABC transporter ATP-binding protein [Anaerolineales bacterium]
MTQSLPSPIKLNQPNTGRLLWRAFGYLRPYRRHALASYLIMLVINGLALTIPQFVRWIVDNGIRQQDTAVLTWSVVGLLALTLVKATFTFWEHRWIEVASQSVAYDLRNAIHDKLAALSFSYHDRTEAGQLLTRAIQDVERIRFLTGRAMLRLAEGGTLLLGTAVLLIIMNPRLALLTLLTMPLLAHRAFQFGRHFRPLSAAIQQQLAVLTTRLEQNLRGARIVKSFAQEDAEIERFDEQNNIWFTLAARAAKLQAINMPLIDFIANLSTVAIIWYGGYLVINSQLSLGELVAFTTYMGQLVQPVRRLGMIIPALAMAAASAERVFEILDAQSEVSDAPDAVPLPPVQGQVRFDDVSFAYFGRHKVLNGITFAAQSGQIIALLGATGSGKST